VVIGPAGAELFQTDGRTDITKIIVAFRDLEKEPSNVNEVLGNNIFIFFKSAKKELTFKYRRLSSIRAVLPLPLCLALPAHASPFQFAPIPNLLLTQRQISLAQEHAGDCNKQHCTLHCYNHQTALACNHVWHHIVLILPMAGLNRAHEIFSGSLSAITQKLRDGLRIKLVSFFCTFISLKYILFLQKWCRIAISRRLHTRAACFHSKVRQKCWVTARSIQGENVSCGVDCLSKDMSLCS
jgi:hypothetical protein